MPAPRHVRRSGTWAKAPWLRVVATAVLALALTQNVTAALAYDWPEFDGSGQHSGSNTLETAITPANVSSLHRVFTAPLHDVADSSPAYLSGVSTTSGVRDLLFVTTKLGWIQALDAHSGALVWQRSFGSTHYTTSSPAVDPNHQYVYTYGLDGKVHKLQVGSGTEVTGGGWPETATLKPDVEKGSSALSIATANSGTSYLYVANGGYPGDAGDYQGHLTSINLTTGAQHVFNTECSNQVDVHFVENGTPDCGHVQSAVWARAGAVYDPDTDRVYFSTGNGDFTPGPSFYWGDSVLALHADGTGASGGLPVDSWTPTNYASLQASDTDLGSTAPALIPASALPASSIYKHIGVQGGKDGILRLLNLDNLSGQGGPGHTGGEIASVTLPSAAFSEVLTHPAVWVNPSDHSIWVIVTDNSGVAAFTVTVSNLGVPGLQARWTKSENYRDSLGSSPLIADGVLFEARPNLLEALNPTTGQQLWSDTGIGDIHWESPVVANGMLYLTDENGDLYGYALPATTTTNLISNGGFESGQIPWQSYTQVSHSTIVSGFGHTGTHSGFLCGYNNCLDALWQTVTVPAGLTQATAGLWLATVTGETSTTSCNDTIFLLFLTPTGSVIQPPLGACNVNTLGAWQSVSVDVTSYLTPYKGQQVSMMILGTTNASLPSYYFVDDVSLTATSSGAAPVRASAPTGPLHTGPAPSCTVTLRGTVRCKPKP